MVLIIFPLSLVIPKNSFVNHLLPTEKKSKSLKNTNHNDHSYVHRSNHQMNTLNIANKY